MKVLIVYDSQFGNTKKIAASIEKGLGENSDTTLIHANDFANSNLEGVDLLIVGTPTHGGRYTKAVSNFIKNLSVESMKQIKVAAFDTSVPKEGQSTFGKFMIGIFKNAAPRLLKALTQKGGQELGYEIFWVLDTKGPLKDDELARAEQWGRTLVERVQ